MASNRKLEFPDQMLKGLTELLAIEGEPLSRLEKELQEATPTLDKDTFASSIGPKLGIDGKNASELMRVLISLYLGKISVRMDTSEFVDKVCEAMEDKDLQPDNGNWEPFKEKLVRILSYDQTLGVTAKALGILTEHEKVYLTGASRIVSDIRPIFTDDLSASPRTAVIIHTLKICYQENNKFKEFFVALDSNDLSELRGLLDREEQKQKGLQAMLDGIVKVLDPAQEFSA
jgi:hypothetical protein